MAWPLFTTSACMLLPRAPFELCVCAWMKNQNDYFSSEFRVCHWFRAMSGYIIGNSAMSFASPILHSMHLLRPIERWAAWQWRVRLLVKRSAFNAFVRTARVPHKMEPVPLYFIDDYHRTSTLNGSIPTSALLLPCNVPSPGLLEQKKKLFRAVDFLHVAISPSACVRLESMRKTIRNFWPVF